MGRSKGGRHSKNKGKSKSKKSDASNKEPEIPYTELDVGQDSNNASDGLEDTKGKNLQANMNVSRSSNTDKELEEMLQMKLHVLYDNAKSWLLSYGYSEADVKRAIVKNGHTDGPKKPLENIVTNTLAVLQNKFVSEREDFKDIFYLCDIMIETHIDHIMRSSPNIQRSDAVWYLLGSDWGSVPSSSSDSHHQADDLSASASSEQLKNEDSLSKLQIGSPLKMVGISTRLILTPELERLLKRRVPLIAAAIRQKMGLPDKEHSSFGPNPEECSDDGEADLSTSVTNCFGKDYHEELIESNADDPLIIDAIKSIRDLQEKIKETRKWAQKKVVEAAKKVSDHLLEVRMLPMDKMYERCLQTEKDYLKQSDIFKLIEIKQILQKAQFQTNATHEAVRKLETENDQIKADIEVSKLNASETAEKLKMIVKSEKTLSRKHADLGKQNSHLRSQCDDHKEEILPLENDLLQAEKEAEEAEMKWRQEVQGKKEMLARLAEETRFFKTQKSNASSKLLALHQKVEMDSQLVRDEHSRLEDELSRLHASNQIENLLPEDESFFYNCPLEISFAANLLGESSQGNFIHRNCMICSLNEVSVFFLPCAHQVVCFQCYESDCKLVGDQCPCCQAQIEQSVRVFGPNS